MALTLTFHGAAGCVTGSCMLLESGNTKLLIDCGTKQESGSGLVKKFDFDPASIDAVVLTHGHLDHCGRVPELFEHGFRGKIFTHYATGELAAIIWDDTLRLSEHARAPFGEQALRQAVKNMVNLDYDQEYRFNGTTVMLHDAGHILGSSHAAIGLDSRRVLFSGDIGVRNTPIIRDPHRAWESGFDAAVIESTYGNRAHKSREETIAEFGALVKDVIQSKGVLLIPSFAIGRTQEMLYHLNGLVESGHVAPLPVFIDSPMASKVTKLYKSYTVCYDDETFAQIEKGDLPLEFPGLHVVASHRESAAIASMRPPFIVIAGSGMCTGGRILGHLKQFAGRPSTTVMIVGWQAGNTLGRALVDGASSIDIDGVVYPVRARIATLGGFSAHAGRDELLEWAGAVKGEPIRWFVNHGEPQAAASLAEGIQEKGLGEAVAVTKGQVVRV